MTILSFHFTSKPQLRCMKFRMDWTPPILIEEYYDFTQTMEKYMEEESVEVINKTLCGDTRLNACLESINHNLLWKLGEA